MNFKQSLEILEKIENSKNILLALHQSPDQDSITSNLLIIKYLKSIDKKWALICCDKVPTRFKEIYDLSDLIEGVDSAKFDLSKFDLFIALDVNQPQRYGFDNKTEFPFVINIDHHYTENLFKDLKVNDTSYSSTSEMIFYMLEDFEFEINVFDAELVLLGILTDTESFSYGASSRVFLTVSKLLEKGVDYDKMDEIVSRNNPIDQIKYWSKALQNLKIDKKYRFAYTSVDLKTVKKYPEALQATRTVADKFVRTLKDTDFGMAMTETEEGYLKISVRSRSSKFGVAELLKSLNGGGHFGGGGGRIDLPYKQAVKKALNIAREFVKNRSKNKPTLS